ncbi:MAG: 4-hydroxy-tetrahydrodipicolinate reductase [Sulfobacillus acidophilus]|uniref:4-hydroxy-tetrahydrodipicolinate reductase n=1 Tax=Sulfobacillus acidophilus TaxID=53633 RepID=A0A2T2WHK3_9FIRM|nr:MAG: 4-hydroxy-tetrahydrodipicolinate reductase [Sulfobacillus acidophilus]
MAIRVAVSGATGWVGRAIAESLLLHPEFELCGAVARKTAGRDLGEVIGVPAANGILIQKTVREVLTTGPDVLVDYTEPLAVKEHVLTALQHGVHVVVGTSGLTANDYAEIADIARSAQRGVVAAGNFSLSATLAKHFSLIAARYMKSWEIVEYADAHKIDAPSGTVQELAEMLGEQSPPQIDVPIDETVGTIAVRGGLIAGVPVHAVRLPGFVLGFDVIFGMDGERLMLRHEAGSSPDPYVSGTLLAIRRVGRVHGLVRGLDRLLFEQTETSDRGEATKDSR